MKTYWTCATIFIIGTCFGIAIADADKLMDIPKLGETYGKWFPFQMIMALAVLMAPAFITGFLHGKDSE